MALFESQFYQPQRINAPAAAAGTSNYFPQALFNDSNINILSDSNNNDNQTPGFYSHHSAAMKRRRELDDSGPLPKRSHYEDRMARRLDSLDLSNENSQSPLSPSIMEDEDLIIDEVDPEILTEDSPLSPSNDFEEEPIIEEPEDEDRLVLSDELQRFMKSSDPQNYLSKFQKKKQGTELVLWRPLPSSDFNASSSSGNASSSSLNDRITEVLDDDEDADINNEVLPDVAAAATNGQSNNHVVTFPDESSSSNRSSSSPQIIDTDPVFSFAHSTSSSSSSSCDGHPPVRMSNGVLQTDYEPMEMD